jgi:homospermidine synthase
VKEKRSMARVAGAPHQAGRAGEPGGSPWFSGRLVLLGFGSIGQGVLPLLLDRLRLSPGQVLVISPGRSGLALAAHLGVGTRIERLDAENLAAVLGSALRPGDFLLNLSVDVSSIALIAWCQDAHVLYLDTCTEPWAGGYIDTRYTPAQRSNHALRRAALALRRRAPHGPTAVLTHGANPGLVSHFVKQALLDLARDANLEMERPADRAGWAALAQHLGVRAIHIAERDTQVRARRRAIGEFVNTWSVDALVDEAGQPAELGWGTHERHFPEDAYRHDDAAAPGIYLARPGGGTRVRSWTPAGGPMHGFLITHAESLSIADYLTVGDPARPRYRPTVHCAYHPCDDALLSLHELAGRDWHQPAGRTVVKDEVIAGMDELGVLLLGHARGAYWYGSQLSIEQTREACDHNNATTLQVAAAVLAGVHWAMRNPACGIVEPEDLPFDEMLALCRPLLGTVVGVYSDWTPLTRRAWLFDEELDRDDPWQFRNVRVN